jgi:tubulin-folding cofactor B
LYCLLCAACCAVLQMTVDAIKAKINSMTGTSVLSMTLHLQDESGRLVDVLQEGSRKLGYYSPRDG